MLITGGAVITMGPGRRVIVDGGVAVDGNRILDVGTSEELISRYKASTVIDATHKIVMPGLFDGHSHAGHGLLKSLGYHNQLWNEACEQVYAEGSTPGFWRAEALLTALERLRFGTTCSLTFLGGGDSVMRSDDPVYGESHCGAVGEVGIREFLAVGPRRPPFPRKYSRWDGATKTDFMVSFDDQLATSRKLIEGWDGGAEGRVRIAMMLPTSHPEHGGFTGEELEELKYMAKTARGLSKEKNVLFSQDGHTKGTVKFAHEELGLLGSDALFSHSTDLTDEEIRLCSETDTRIVHNPSAVASMVARCPVPELIDAGVTVMLGSDASAPDRSFDMFRHMFQCMRYHRRHFRDDRVLPPGKVLEMATIDAAKAMGLEQELGSLEPGKKADLILVDARKPHLYPLNMAADRIAYYANGADVDTVIVDGKVLMEGCDVKTVDVDMVLDLAQEETEAMLDRSNLRHLMDYTEGYWGRSRY